MSLIGAGGEPWGWLNELQAMYEFGALTIENPYENHRTTTGKPQETHRKTIGKP